jgi:mannose-6-phosphate isomerase-like protein (cupin superfamily)
MVLKGAAKFYGPGDVVIGDLKEMDGIVLPGGARYWFETTGDVPLEILHITAVENAKTKDQRINVDKHKDWMTESNLQVYDDK